jgi:hypothetical protein
MPYPRDPEIINSDLKRLKVEGGWLVYSAGGLIYKTDADYTWALEPLPVVEEPPPEPEPAPEPTPEPVPTELRPDVIENMVWDSAQGAYVSQDIWRSTCAALHFLRPEITYGKLVTISFKRRANYPLSGNIKLFRVWKDAPGSYPNWYAGLQTTGAMMLYTEKLNPVTGVSRFYFTYPPHTGEWREEHWMWLLPSGIGRPDGEISIRVAGVNALYKTGWQCDDAANPGVPNLICIQSDPSNMTLPEGSTEAYKDIQITVTT